MDAPRALKSLRAEELRQLCKEQGLDSRGLKGELIQRLAELRADQTGDAPAAQSPQRPSPKAKSKAKAKAKAAATSAGRNRREPAGRSSPSLATNSRGAAPALLRRQPLGAGQGVSLWAASRQQLMRCVRCQATCDLQFGRYSNSPDLFWCPLCRFKVMDPFNPIAEGSGILKLMMIMEPHFDFSLELPELRQWRREGKTLEVRMVRVDSTKVEQVWPRQIHFFANGAEVFAVHPPEEGHKRRDVPHNISAQLKAGRNDITVRMVDDNCVGFALVILLTCPQTVPDLLAQVENVSVGAAKKRVCELLAKQAASARAGAREDGEELVCLTEDALKLRCPITMERVQDPVRGELCQHTQCFSLEAYMTSNRHMGAFNRRWLCPLCTQTLRPWDLRRDGYVAEVLAATPADVDEVLVNSDGSWRVPGGVTVHTAEDTPLVPNDAPPPVPVTLTEEPVDLDSPMQSPLRGPAAPPPEPVAPLAEPLAVSTQGAAQVESPRPASGSPATGPRTPGAEVRSRPRLLLDKPSSAARNGQDRGYSLAVAMSMMGGVFGAENATAPTLASPASAVASARQRRLAQLELQDDDNTSPAKKAQPKRRPPSASKGNKSKRPRKDQRSPAQEAATPARSASKAPFSEPIDMAEVGIDTGLRPIDLD